MSYLIRRAAATAKVNPSIREADTLANELERKIEVERRPSHGETPRRQIDRVNRLRLYRGLIEEMSETFLRCKAEDPLLSEIDVLLQTLEALGAMLSNPSTSDLGEIERRDFAFDPMGPPRKRLRV